MEAVAKTPLQREGVSSTTTSFKYTRSRQFIAFGLGWIGASLFYFSQDLCQQVSAELKTGEVLFYPSQDKERQDDEAEIPPVVDVDDDPVPESSREKTEDIRFGTTTLKQGKHQNLEEEKKKPWLILHIGPSKTGSTTIQCGLDQNSHILRDLDNYYYLGCECEFPRNKNRLMRNNETAILCTQLAWYFHSGGDNASFPVVGQEILPRLYWHQSHGHNVIVSSEHLFDYTSDEGCGNKWNTVQDLFRGFRVKAIMVNRILVDLLPSYYYQKMMFSRQYANDKQLPPLLTYVDQHFKFWDLQEQLTTTKSSSCPTIVVPPKYTFVSTLDFRPALHLWAKCFDFEVMDFYGYDGDIFGNFVCNYLPDAKGTCHHLEQRRRNGTALAPIQVRQSKSVHPRRAYSHIMEQKKAPVSSKTGNSLKKELNAKYRARTIFSRRAQTIFDKYGVEEAGSLYMDCITAPMEKRLLDVSLAIAQTIHKMQHCYHPTYMSTEQDAIDPGQQGKDMHMALWKKKMASRTYCDLNLERLFANQTISSELRASVVANPMLKRKPVKNKAVIHSKGWQR